MNGGGHGPEPSPGGAQAVHGRFLCGAQAGAFRGSNDKKLTNQDISGARPAFFSLSGTGAVAS
jgi:hypothetical protein